VTVDALDLVALRLEVGLDLRLDAGDHQGVVARRGHHAAFLVDDLHVEMDLDLVRDRDALEGDALFVLLSRVR
jgi:hypothetical protein